jgi:hypothetical protein
MARQTERGNKNRQVGLKGIKTRVKERNGEIKAVPRKV